MEINLFDGIVVAIDTSYIDSRGINIPVIYVKSNLDGSVFPIPWLPIGPCQYMPKIGQYCLYYRQGTQDNRIICFYGNNEPHIRKGEFGLNQGEFQIQSDTGFGYLKANDDGTVGLISGDGTSVLQSDENGWSMQAPNIVINNYKGCQIKLNEDSSIEISRLDSKGNVLDSFKMIKDNGIEFQTKGKFKVMADGGIQLDGAVIMGPGATDDTKAASAAQTVTSGPFGTYPFDFTTGAAIPGTTNVKIIGS